MARPFTVVAIIAAHNEADVIEHVVCDLIEQGVSVYFIDDDSTDGTREIVERYVGRGVLAVERFDGQPGMFEWERILRRKVALASELDADWFIHHDADEFRESPWSGVSLIEAIERIDRLGFNAIDFVRHDFWPTHNDFQPGTDVRQAFVHWMPPAPYDRLQVRCWKRTLDVVDLDGSGGHDVRFRDRSVFPIKFLLRHYPVRGRDHARRKIADRRGRFLPEERGRGWHVQYDEVSEASAIRDPSTMTRYDPVAVRIDLALDRDRWRDLERAVQTLTSDLDQARAASHERDREVHALTGALTETNERLAAIERSLSWRWTAPARRALGILRRTRP